MAEDENIPLDNDSEDQYDDNGNDENGYDEKHPFEKKNVDDNIIPLSGLYENWFLDYASYVILERAVPSLYDGFKPVQRRIMHSMKELDDGRYNKVANVIGNTMKYHPHGDASIGDALVALGQKDLLIDCQGNWGNTLTGDGAAAPRYIEARLSKFASHVVFNPKTTNWLLSYDGRNKEPDNLPVKFPILLAQGAEGIAVGMACKILPHNFIELIDQSINHLRGKKVEIYPDFMNGGMADFSNYNDGLRGGKVRVRAKIKKFDNKTLMINEIPFGCTTTSLIESVLKANEKGKIKIRKIEDNTAAEAEIVIHLAPGVSPDKTIDALYAFTDCEVSISPNASVIDGDTPRFMGVTEILRTNTDNTLQLLKRELEIRLTELQQQWHFATLEKIFIREEMYIDFKHYSDRETLYGYLYKRFEPFKKSFIREIVDEDLAKLTQIPMIRITRFDSDKADELIAKLEAEMEEVRANLANLVEYAIEYFKDLKKRFGAGKERKTEIKIFDTIAASKVIIANRKLYVDTEEGFIGWGLKKTEAVNDCSEIDDIIVFFNTGKFMITKVSEKKFVGKGIVHADVWKKGDKRTIYHVMYQDGVGGATMMKRFFVNSVTRDTEYDLTRGVKGSKLLYFSVHPNGEREVVTIHLRPRPHLKRLRFDIDLGDLLIKARSAAGNRVTKEIVQKITQKEVGGSTLAARKIWFDTVVGRLNDEGRGKFLGSFKGEDRLLTLYKNGEYRLSTFDLSNHFDEDMVHIEKWVPDRPISAVYFDAERELHFVKRFCCEITSDKRVSYISESEGSYLDVVSTAFRPKIKIVYNKLLKETKNLPDNEVEVADFIEVKGMKAQGNQLTKLRIKEVLLTHPIEGDIPWPEDETLDLELDTDSDDVDATDGEAPTIEWDLSKPDEDDEDVQPTLF
ncbi:MAG: DNA topoisomerase IV [Candidatus Fluviicola riflensis]|nr:MAG: DNA topoisomerase IV [Candidatus Fluviicola riflensis]OGS79242.1 MAG: DNA topoisomerase IV [Candidatus Fluviicola riflensis]OGS86674.1 MAG: DNA topoisomerase IV [Fluviicola sp. RIFCSPHIGHO2_01_FULL_43_53]OGS88852.1 MAG: DNA topoisomerase IV [Fluviicola sp. RIFCSPHIGHO2_12_FULL_43_24]